MIQECILQKNYFS